MVNYYSNSLNDTGIVQIQVFTWGKQESNGVINKSRNVDNHIRGKALPRMRQNNKLNDLEDDSFISGPCFFFFFENEGFKSMTPEVPSSPASDIMTAVPIAIETIHPFGPPIPQKNNTQYHF